MKMTPVSHTGQEMTPVSHTGHEMIPVSHTGQEMTPVSHTGQEMTPVSHTGQEMTTTMKMIVYTYSISVTLLPTSKPTTWHGLYPVLKDLPLRIMHLSVPQAL